MLFDDEKMDNVIRKDWVTFQLKELRRKTILYTWWF
jgi:hypothetical protein